MKKKNLKRNELKLNKNTISSLASASVKGAGTNISCFFDVDGNCAATVTTCPTTTNGPTQETCGCVPPPTNPCPSQIGGICKITKSPGCN
ncbi:MAG: hypothetical protein AAF611_06235 [Bacteroidota bacterium]